MRGWVVKSGKMRGTEKMAQEKVQLTFKCIGENQKAESNTVKTHFGKLGIRSRCIMEVRVRRVAAFISVSLVSFNSNTSTNSSRSPEYKTVLALSCRKNTKTNYFQTLN